MARQRDGVSRRRLLAALGVAIPSGCSGIDSTVRDSGSTSGTEATEDATGTGPAGAPTGAHPGPGRIDAVATTLLDERVDLVLSGFESNATVTLTGRTASGRGVEWRSEVSFEADASGRVSVADAVPVSGPYWTAAPMGPFWSMHSSGGNSSWFVLPDEEMTVGFEASVNGEVRAEREVARRVAAEGVTERDVSRPVERDVPRDGGGYDELVGRFFEPAGDGPHPGVLLLHGSGGRVPVGFGRLLASRGYAALGLRYIGGPGQPELPARVPLEYFSVAIDWLRDRASVADAPVGAWGGSRGGELALLLGARHDAVGSVVSYVGSGLKVVNVEGATSWVEDGEPLTHLLVDWSRREPVKRAVEDADEDYVADAAIPVEDVDAPVFLASGRDDRLWSSAYLSQLAANRLRRSDFDRAFDHRAYEGAGHLLRPPYIPMGGTTEIGGRVYGGTVGGNARASADAWRRALQFLERGLG